MLSRFTSILLATAMLSANVVQAAANLAEIGSIQGKVLVNQGKGFVALAEGSSLAAGDRVMVGKKSLAVIAYSNGCLVSINETKVVTVAKVAPCKDGAHLAMVGSELISPVADIVDPVVPFFGAPLLLVGGGVAVIGTILILKKNDGAPGTAGP